MEELGSIKFRLKRQSNKLSEEEKGLQQKIENVEKANKYFNKVVSIPAIGGGIVTTCNVAAFVLPMIKFTLATGALIIGTAANAGFEEMQILNQLKQSSDIYANQIQYQLQELPFVAPLIATIATLGVGKIGSELLENYAAKKRVDQSSVLERKKEADGIVEMLNGVQKEQDEFRFNLIRNLLNKMDCSKLNQKEKVDIVKNFYHYFLLATDYQNDQLSADELRVAGFDLYDTFKPYQDRMIIDREVFNETVDSSIPKRVR